MIDAVLTIGGTDYVMEIPNVSEDTEAIRGGPLWWPHLKVDPPRTEASLAIRSAAIPIYTQTVFLTWMGSSFMVRPEDFDPASQTGVWVYK